MMAFPPACPKIFSTDLVDRYLPVLAPSKSFWDLNSGHQATQSFVRVKGRQEESYIPACKLSYL